MVNINTNQYKNKINNNKASSIYYVAQFGGGWGQEPRVNAIELTLQNSVTYGGGGPANLNFNAT